MKSPALDPLLDRRLREAEERFAEVDEALARPEVLSDPDQLRELGGPPRPAPAKDDPDRPDTAAEQLAWLAAAGFAAVDIAWKDEQVGVLVARRGEDVRP